MTILDANGDPIPGTEQPDCDHGVTFDEDAAKLLLGDWKPLDAGSFIMGNPAAALVRARWPRLMGNCPKGCGFSGIAYASYARYIAGDW